VLLGADVGFKATYDYTGANNYLSVFHNAVSVYVNATVKAGERVDKQLIDMSLQSGYQMMDAVSKTPQEAASEYYQTDWVNERLLSTHAT